MLERSRLLCYGWRDDALSELMETESIKHKRRHVCYLVPVFIQSRLVINMKEEVIRNEQDSAR